MHRLVAAGTPAGSTAEEWRVIAPADEDLSRRGLLLEMALEAESLIARDQHALVYRTVGLVAGRASFAQGFVLEHKWAELDGVAFAAGFVFRHQRGATALDGVSFVRLMAIIAMDLPFKDRMMMGQAELPLLVQVTLETGFGRFVRIDDSAARAAGLIVDAPWSVARLAADIRGVVSRRLESCVCRGLEIPDNLIVALGAGLRPHEFGAGNGRRRHHGAVDRGAGDTRHRRRHDAGHHEQSAALDVSPRRITVLLGRVVRWISRSVSVGFRRPLRLSELFTPERQKRR
jgi:hypothetical protein